MPQHFVEIVNRGTYTSVKKASFYVNRGLAQEYFLSLDGRVLQIWMLDAAQLALMRSQINHERREANIDDGIPRRWVNRPSGMRGGPQIATKQLRPVSEVGFSKHVTKRRDMLFHPSRG